MNIQRALCLTSVAVVLAGGSSLMAQTTTGGLSGKVTEIRAGEHTITETVCVLTDAQNVTHELSMMQKWPVRRGRPYQEKASPKEPMVTGQRVIDTFFPIASGGVAAVPGPCPGPRPSPRAGISFWPVTVNWASRVTSTCFASVVVTITR